MKPDPPESLQSTASILTGENDRQETRQQLRHRRAQLDRLTLMPLSHACAANILPLLADAQHIGAYLAFGNEVCTDELMAQRRALGQFTYVPLIQPDHTLRFAPITDSTAIAQNKYGIREPDVHGETCLPATSLDIVIVPLLGFDAQCNRMGMGGGYYDRTFAHKRQAKGGKSAIMPPLLIGAAFEFQRVEQVFADWWDVPLDHVVTEQRIYSRNGPLIQARDTR